MVLQYARKHGQITRREAAEPCRLDSKQASRLLAQVADSHPDVRLEGERPGARYVWRGPHPPGKRNDRAHKLWPWA